mgnify:CR=1 FL=1
MLSQRDLVIEHLKKNGSITPLLALNLFGIMRLSAIIYDLKKEGYQFKTEIKRTRNRFVARCIYAEYTLIGGI